PLAVAAEDAGARVLQDEAVVAADERDVWVVGDDRALEAQEAERREGEVPVGVRGRGGGGHRHDEGAHVAGAGRGKSQPGPSFFGKLGSLSYMSGRVADVGYGASPSARRRSKSSRMGRQSAIDSATACAPALRRRSAASRRRAARSAANSVRSSASPRPSSFP